MNAITLFDAGYTLQDCYARRSGRVILTGMQALVRLPMMQRRIDEVAGLNTAGLVSGYRGSPLGGYDQALWKARKVLEEHQIKFEPGVNEDLGATLVWGTQRLHFYPNPKYDGVFGIWYGKGPGIDRTLDVFRHANFAGTAKNGGILALVGDDHAASSSIFPHQTDHVFESAQIPLLNPANLPEVLEFGLAGIAMSRFAGVWSAMKTISDVIETTATIDLDTLKTDYLAPADFVVPPHGLNTDPTIAWPAERFEFERRMMEEKLPAVAAFAHANGLNRVITSAAKSALGVITTGKAHVDFMEGLARANISPGDLSAAGIQVLKIGLSWPLDPRIIRDFAADKSTILVIEEKRSYVERQVKEILFNLPQSRRADIWGKTTPQDEELIRADMNLNPTVVAKGLIRWLQHDNSTDKAKHLALVIEHSLPAAMAAPQSTGIVRKPFFCAGCPHNHSTKVPDGSYAGGGIGCHVMAIGQGRNTEVITHMGGEGANWVGLAPFTGVTHMFQNLGDGTYQHSGVLAIRQAVAAGTNITYKILYNDAVAMTGGQPAEGSLSPEQIAQQVRAEGVERVAIVAEDPEALDRNLYPPRTSFHPRIDLEAVQNELKTVKGTSVLINVQTCAAEKRRRRKRGKMAMPDTRMFINPRVCEGCGDCSKKSNCIAVEPIDTVFGRKRKINQSSCNIDASCAEGFCPSFVSVKGGTLRAPAQDVFARAGINLESPLPEPAVTEKNGAYSILVTGIGGTGVVTIGALLSMAAHLEHKTAVVQDHTGLAQKNGAVVSHVRIAPEGTPVHTTEIPEGATDLLLGCDMVVTGTPAVLGACSPERTIGIISVDEMPTADFVKDQNIKFPSDPLKANISARIDRAASLAIPAARWTEDLLGNTTGAHLFLMGVAFQKGLIPLSETAILRAVELNGAFIDMNMKAFRMGRLAGSDVEGFATKVGSVRAPTEDPEPDTQALITRLADELSKYADAAYAQRFTDRVAKVAELAGADGIDLTRTVAKSYYKVLAYKDEYEVARLYSDPAFITRLKDQFSDWRQLKLHLAPPLFARKDPVTGEPRKSVYGSWIFTAFKVLGTLKRLRGTPLDIFGYTAERKAERALIAQYEEWLDSLNAAAMSDIKAITTKAALPQEIRGFGHVKEKSIDEFQARWQAA